MRSKKPLFALSFVAIVIALAIWKLNLFTLDRIDIQIDHAVCVKEYDIKNEVDLLVKNILFIDTEKINKNLLQKYPCIRDISMERKLPKNLQVQVSGRVPLVRLASYNSSPALSLDNLEATPSSSAAFLDWSLPEFVPKQFVTDETGVVFEKNDEDNLPTIFLPNQNFKIGQQLDKNLFNKVNIIFNKLDGINYFSSDNIDYGLLKIKISGNYFLMQTQQKLVLSLSKDLLRQLASLQLILQKAKIDGRAMESIDLRFDKPVIIYASNKK